MGGDIEFRYIGTVLTRRQESEEARPDVIAAVDELLNTVSNKFASVSSEIFAKSEPGMEP